MAQMHGPARKSPRRNKQLHVREAVEGRIKTAERGGPRCLSHLNNRTEAFTSCVNRSTSNPQKKLYLHVFQPSPLPSRHINPVEWRNLARETRETRSLPLSSTESPQSDPYKNLRIRSITEEQQPLPRLFCAAEMLTIRQSLAGKISLGMLLD